VVKEERLFWETSVASVEPTSHAGARTKGTTLGLKADGRFGYVSRPS